MALFDLFRQKEGTKFNNVAVKTRKQAYEGEKATPFCTFVKRITAPDKSNALKIFDTQLKSGLITLPDSLTTDNLPTKTVIFCDFNGVIDEYGKELHRSHESAAFRVPEMADPDKVFAITKIAMKHNAKLVMTSEWRKQNIDYRCIVTHVLRNSDNPEHVELYNQLKSDRQLLRQLTSGKTEVLRGGSRSSEIQKYIDNNDVTKCVTVEDSHPIKESLNPVMTHSHIGLQQEHIDQIDEILSRG